MNVPYLSEPLNGRETAAIFAASVGVFALGLANVLGGWAVLAGVLAPSAARPLLTLVSLAVWVSVWFWSDRRWGKKRFSPRFFMALAGLLALLGLILASPLACYLLRLPWV